jgi:hypothetical protein
VSAIQRERGWHPVLFVSAVVWTFVAAGICIPALGQVDADALLLVGAASTVGLACGGLGTWLVTRDELGWAAVALVVSAVVTPTYFAYVLNLVPLATAVACVRRR